MIPSLPASFLTTPIAHRAYHDVAQGRPENSRAAIRAAIAEGYGIEIDLQLTRDNQAMVFHDYGLSRLTGQGGVIRQHSLAQAQGISLSGGDGEGIPSFAEVLDLVSGQVPLLVELKDQDGAMGDDLGPLEEAAAKLIQEYSGDLAVMSFNPNSVARMAELLPAVPRGIVTSAYVYDEWPLSKAVCDHLRAIPDFDRVKACFISHESIDLNRPRVAELKARGIPILCWTIRSAAEEATARAVADNVTFEGYAADVSS
ncbi:MAG: phosphodiesterase [Rhodobacteraceae bacterium]|nr:phosphodiesterase [Paracoccaceae bacterium]